MNPVPPWTTQFALPCEQENPQVFDTIVNTHGVAMVAALLRLHGAAIARASSGLRDFLASWAAEPGPSDTPWDIAFGRLQLAVAQWQATSQGEAVRFDPVDVAAKVGLRIAESGHRGAWQMPFSPEAVRVGGWLVPHADRAEVENLPSAPARIRVHADGIWHSLQRDAADGVWRVSGTGHSGASAVGVERLRTVGAQGGVLLLPSRALPPAERSGDIFKECQPVDVVDDAAAQSFADGFTLLARNTPRYLPWIERVLHGIVVCPRQVEYRLVSGSFEDAPGLVHMSSPHSGVDIAEVLVHECAHQYFYMLQRVGPVDDASDATLYWSPPIRKRRPLSRILMAYHALANVQLLFDAVRANPSNDAQVVGYVRINEPELQAAIEALDEPLRGNSALTPLGRGLYEPLAQRLAQRLQAAPA